MSGKGGKMGLALHLKAAGGDPANAGYVIGVAVMLLAAAVAGIVVAVRARRHNAAGRIRRHDLYAAARGEVEDRLAVLEEQLAVERKYRQVLQDAVVAAFEAAQRPPPEDVTATSPQLRAIRG